MAYWNNWTPNDFAASPATYHSYYRDYHEVNASYELNSGLPHSYSNFNGFVGDDPYMAANVQHIQPQPEPEPRPSIEDMFRAIMKKMDDSMSQRKQFQQKIDASYQRQDATYQNLQIQLAQIASDIDELKAQEREYEVELNLAMQPEFQEPSSPAIYEEEEQPTKEIEEPLEHPLELEIELKEAEPKEQIGENSDLEEKEEVKEEKEFEEEKEEVKEEKEVECSNEVESMEQEKHEEKEECLPPPSLLSPPLSPPPSLPPPHLPPSILLADFASPLPPSSINFANFDEYVDFDKCLKVAEFQNYKDLVELDYIEHIDFVFQDESKFNNKAKLRIAIGMGIMRIVLHLDKRIILILLLPLALHFTFHIFSTLEIQTYVKTCLPPTLIFDPG